MSLVHTIFNTFHGGGSSIRAGLMYAPFQMRKAAKVGESVMGALTSNVGRSLKSGYHLSFAGAALFNVPIAAYSMATAARGHKVAAGVSGLTSGVGSLIGGAIGGLPGALIGGFLLDSVIGNKIASGVQKIHDIDGRMRGLGFGGNYVDTQQAATMRQSAVREMSGSLANARQYLGREGAFMHS
jgi:hypothetical protein